MLQPIEISQRFEFISKEDNTEPKTVFVIKPLSTREMFSLMPESSDGQIKLSSEKIFKLLEASIVEIRNFKDGAVNDLIPLIPAQSLTELVQEIAKINKMTGQDQKN